MRINPILFEAYLKCPTKCFLLSRGEFGTGNAYADWVRRQSDSYRESGIKHLTGTVNPNECVFGQLTTEMMHTGKWRLAIDFAATAEHLESSIHVVERIPTERSGVPAQLMPTRFAFTNKLTADDKLLIAFDAYALSKVTRGEVSRATIIHGDTYARLKVNTGALSGKFEKLIDKTKKIVSSDSPPDLILNRHCVECEFQSRCGEKALEKDDLSLLSRMTEKERKKFNSKGIFTVTQLSFTFRPRRRPKRWRNKREKYHHSLRAFAIQQKKIHIVGSPQWKIEGTALYLDVEALPDRDFYYLIGVQIGTHDAVVQHSFWADDVKGEEIIWRDFLATLAEVENPILIHYGSFETTFLKRMLERYGELPEGSVAAKAVKSAVNLVPFLFGQVYFPTYSNSIKEIGAWLGCTWSSKSASGTQSIIWRSNWEQSRDPTVKQTLVTYNLEDCRALQSIVETLPGICDPDKRNSFDAASTSEVASGDSQSRGGRWGQFSSPIADFEAINKAAHWDYQRDRIYVKTDHHLKSVTATKKTHALRRMPINQEVKCEDLQVCPDCARAPDKVFAKRPRIIYDIRITNTGLKRWVVKYRFRFYWCASCDKRFGLPEAVWPNGRQFGRNLVAIIIFETIGLNVPLTTLTVKLNRLFRLDLSRATVMDFKASAAAYYAGMRERILDNMVKGHLIHADETHIRLRDRQGYVWVFASLHEVVYFFTESREGDGMRERLKEFRGVLVSDFYKAYDSFPGPQQKCLLHLMRDLNEAVLDLPYDIELKQVVTGFGELLKHIVQTIDRWGLKSRFLRKHQVDVERFYQKLSQATYHSDAALKWKDRFERNRDSLFTFLQYDGVPWNNNNAEHAIKAFARLRRIIVGLSTTKGIEDYLILLSVCQTCKYSGIDFLDFLRSGKRTIDAVAKSKGGKR